VSPKKAAKKKKKNTNLSESCEYILKNAVSFSVFAANCLENFSAKVESFGKRRQKNRKGKKSTV